MRHNPLPHSVQFRGFRVRVGRSAHLPSSFSSSPPRHETSCAGRAERGARVWVCKMDPDSDNIYHTRRRLLQYTAVLGMRTNRTRCRVPGECRCRMRDLIVNDLSMMKYGLRTSYRIRDGWLRIQRINTVRGARKPSRPAATPKHGRTRGHRQKTSTCKRYT